MSGTPDRSGSSRQRYRRFVQDYRARRLDEEEHDRAGGNGASPSAMRRARRREFLREYMRWLRPQRYALAVVMGMAAVVAGLEMIEPLFMRFIIDRVLLAEGLDAGIRFSRLNMVGAAFLSVIILTNGLRLVKDYRQRLLNTHVMLSLRRALF
jgi:ATP-binding cassette, subfamily B, bacterial